MTPMRHLWYIGQISNERRKNALIQFTLRLIALSVLILQSGYRIIFIWTWFQSTILLAFIHIYVEIHPLMFIVLTCGCGAKLLSNIHVCVFLAKRNVLKINHNNCYSKGTRNHCTALLWFKHWTCAHKSVLNCELACDCVQFYCPVSFSRSTNIVQHTSVPAIDF